VWYLLTFLDSKFRWIREFILRWVDAALEKKDYGERQLRWNEGTNAGVMVSEARPRKK